MVAVAVVIIVAVAVVALLLCIAVAVAVAALAVSITALGGVLGHHLEDFKFGSIVADTVGVVVVHTVLQFQVLESLIV